MSNVAYECPVKGCGARLFAPPGGTSIPCMRHPESVYQQIEEYHGPNFRYKEEGEVAPDKTGVATPGVDRNAVAVKNVKVQLPEMSPDELKVYYREQYKKVSGQSPDFRWGVTRLKEEITAWEEEHTPPPSVEPNADENGESVEGSGDEETLSDDTPDDTLSDTSNEEVTTDE